MARVQRLRAGFALNYAAIGLVTDLLDRITVLETARAGPEARKVNMDPSHLTQKSQEALHDAQTKALRFGHTEVDVEHLLLALLDQAEGIVPRLLSQPGRIRTGYGRHWRPSSRGTPGCGPGVNPGQISITQRLARLLDTAEQEAAG